MIETAPDTVDLYTAAVQLSSTYRLDLWVVHAELTRLYGFEEEIPVKHLADLARQIEEQTRHYQVVEEKIDVALALVSPKVLTGKQTRTGTRYIPQKSPTRKTGNTC